MLHSNGQKQIQISAQQEKIYKDADARETLIVYDGTPSGAFLLSQIDDALKQITYKRLMVKPTVLVMVSVTDPMEIQLVLDRVKEIKSVFLESVNWITAHIACCMYTESKVFLEDVCNGAELIPEYNDVISSCSIPTYQKELERVLKEKCLQMIANSLSISKCMVPDDADDLGRLAIDQLCLGRGGSLSALVTVLDKRDDFMLIRPLCDVSKKEISIYNHLCGIDEHCIPIAQTKIETKSVQSLTDSFIRTLENEKFYSTINTVLSTASKIHNTNSSKEGSRCLLCFVETADTLCKTCLAIQRACTGDKIGRFVR
uniref:Cytoplasmic tRNA 2-thiolation protein 2 n=1 Tax=Caenorhabditis tropicalis TaxID=1561998 RepID=A0A1I7U746_9PELO